MHTSGEFAKLANVTLRTIRYYDKENLLKPSFVANNGFRYYNDKDLIKLQQILLFKYLGFSLKEIKSMNLNDLDPITLSNALFVQKKMVEEKIEQMIKVEQAINNTANELKKNNYINWESMISLIHLTNETTNTFNQYKDASNLTTRINLHDLYSTNKIGWFNWLHSNIDLSYYDKVLEIGCGDGSLWKKQSSNYNITLSDKSEGMVNDARRNLGDKYNYQVIECESIPFVDNYFDLVLANHVMFYLDDLKKGLSEVQRVLKDTGTFICSTYGKSHMIEIEEIVQKFDPTICLSKNNLYNVFGKKNGHDILKPYFNSIEWRQYEDSLYVNNVDALIAYIVSCHGNQNEIILPRYQEFRKFIINEVGNGLKITKDAGIFFCKKRK